MNPTFNNPNIDGWFDWQNLWDAVVESAHPTEVNHVAEIGVLQGKSLWYLIQAAKASGKCFVIHAIDPFPGEVRGKAATKAQFEANMIAAGVPFLAPDGSELVTLKVHVGFSQDQSMVRRFEDGSLFAVMVDGAHNYEPCSQDLALYWPKVKEKGWLLVHDYTVPSGAEVNQHVGFKVKPPFALPAKSHWPEVAVSVNEFATKNKLQLYVQYPTDSGHQIRNGSAFFRKGNLLDTFANAPSPTPQPTAEKPTKAKKQPVETPTEPVEAVSETFTPVTAEATA